METLMFAVGALSMVLLAVASLAVFSTVMVLKLKDELKLTHKMIDDVYATINHISREQSHEIDKKESQLQIEMRLGEQELSNQMDQLNEHIEQLQSYVDRRFDKLIDTYLLVKETEKESKKIIKG